MEFENSKQKAINYKIALSIALIRSKPSNLTLEQFIQLLQAQFKSSYVSNRDQILELKHFILKIKQELFVQENSDILSNEPIEQNESEKPKKTKNINECELKFKLKSNLEFLSSIIKLKAIRKGFKTKQALSDTSAETIFETILMFLHQINLFFNGANLMIEDMTVKGDKGVLYPMPKDTLEHAVSLFVNVFDLEWIYYLRRQLLDDILQFMDNLVKFIILCDSSKEVNSIKQICACNMLSTLSSSDYLLNSVLLTIMKYLELALQDIISSKESNENLNILSNNCNQLANCIEDIILIRKLDNFNSINQQLKVKLCQSLNKIFIELTEQQDPLLAFQITKIIQILSIQEK